MSKEVDGKNALIVQQAINDMDKRIRQQDLRISELQNMIGTLNLQVQQYHEQVIIFKTSSLGGGPTSR